MAASLFIAFATILYYTETNRHQYAIVHGRILVPGKTTAELSSVTRASSRRAAEEALSRRLAEMKEWGWEVTGSEIGNASEFAAYFKDAFSDRPTKSPYLSFKDDRRLKVRVYFFGDEVDALLREYQARLVSKGVSDLKVIRPKKSVDGKPARA